MSKRTPKTETSQTEEAAPAELQVVGIHKDWILISRSLDGIEDPMKVPAVIYGLATKSFSRIETIGYFARHIKFRDPGNKEREIPTGLSREILEKLLIG